MKKYSIYTKLLFAGMTLLSIFFIHWMVAGTNTVIHVLSSIGVAVSVLTVSVVLVLLSETGPKYFVTNNYVDYNRVLLINIEDPEDKLQAYDNEFLKHSVINKSDISFIETAKGITAFSKPGPDKNLWAIRIEKKLRSEEA